MIYVIIFITRERKGGEEMPNKVDDLETFKKHRNSISESLETTLVGRDKEVKEILNLISNNDFLVISGPSGIGKSRLAVAAMEEYQNQTKNCKILCTKSFSDYINALDKEIKEKEKYIIFIDDANNYSKLIELIDFLKYKNNGNIKVVLTIRDYLKECFDSRNQLLAFYDVKPLEDTQIKEAILQNTIIKNEQWLEQISKIASGNIRVAFIASETAIKNNNDFLSLFNQSTVLNKTFPIPLYYNSNIFIISVSSLLIVQVRHMPPLESIEAFIISCSL